MGFTEAVKTCLSKSFTVKGRATRSEFWYFMLCQFLTYLVAIIFLLLNADWISDGSNNLLAIISLVIGVLAALAYLCYIPASICAQVRRLHDTGRSGAYWFLSFVPFGGLVLLYFCVLPSVGDNEYGDNTSKE